MSCYVSLLHRQTIESVYHIPLMTFSLVPELLYARKFYIPLPLNLPGSVELKQKGGAIRYELQANFFHKPKS